MTIAMSELVDAEPCDVLRGGDGPVYFLLGGQLYVVHEVLGRWIEADTAAATRPVFERGGSRSGGTGAGPTVPEPRAAETDPAQADRAQPDRGQADRERRVPEPSADESQADELPMVEHWLVTASVGRFGRPAVFRLQRRPAPPAKGPDSWTVRAERR